MKIDKTVHSPMPVGETFAFLADFTTTEEWDPGTERTELVQGEGGVGTTYRNVSTFLGKQTELTYVVEEHQPGERIVLRGENGTVVAHDTMTFAPTPDGGTQVRYQAEFTLKGLAKLAAPVMAPAVKKLGEDGATQMEKVLRQRALR